MAPPERSLIPPEDQSFAPSSTDATAPRVRCSSNVVGVVPREIHDVLLRASSSADGSASSSSRGRVDDHGSGISFLLEGGNVGTDEEDGGSSIITVWEHSTQTLNEDLVPPARGLCAKLAHPEHDDSRDHDDGLDDNASHDLIVACVGPDNAAAEERARGGRALRHVYAASPATGVLCAWVLDSNASARHQRRGRSSVGGAAESALECDASVRLRLRPGEILTALTPVVEGGNGGGGAWLLASTSLGRLWKIYKTSRPLALHAKLVKRERISLDDSSEITEEEEEGTGTGIVGSLFGYFTTPSKATGPAPRPDEDVAMDDETQWEDEGIAALVTVPPLASLEGGDVDVVITNRSPTRTPGRHPRKQQRISSTPPVGGGRDSSGARAVSLSSSLVLREWNISLLAAGLGGGPEGENGGAVAREGCLSSLALFPRNSDGTLDLGRLLPNPPSGDDDDGGLAGYRRVEMMAPPSLSRDGRSLLVAVRVDRGRDGGEGDGAGEEAARAYVVRVGLAGADGPRIMDAAWLDRYSGESLGVLECAGLVVAEAGEEDAAAAVAGGGAIGGSVVYVGFGPRGHGRQPYPVTISAVHFPSSSAVGAGAPERQRLVRDMDLHARNVPSLVRGSMGYDSLMGGCVFLATNGLLGGASARFPPVGVAPVPRGAVATGGGGTTTGSAPMDESLLQQDEAVLAIKSHLQSAFRQYMIKAKEGGGGGNHAARSVVPPSIGTCASSVLSAAAVLASGDYARASLGGGGRGSFSPARAGAASQVMALRDKLESHRELVNFLAHAGAYRRVSAAGRARLRDHGELLTASRALLTGCQGYFSNAEAAAAGDSTRRGELARVRRLVTDALEGTSDDVIALPSRWARLQRLPADEPSLAKDLLLLTSSSVCQGIGQALRYRENESGPLYDIPSHDGPLAPWTSSLDMLEVLFVQLQAIQESGESVLSTSLHSEAERANLRQYVEDISASALSGYHDVVLREPNNEEAVKIYEDTKLLSVPLLRQYANNDGDDLVALQTSLAHSFFEGIVQICHDHRESWKFRGPFSDEEPDARYDLRPMISNTSPDSPYAHLHRSRDYRTGLPFCSYVLRWYADRGLNPEVFELGKECPHDLMRYVRNDGRLSDLAWIQHLRVGAHEQATKGLLGLTSSTLFGDKHGGAMGLWEKDQMMSIAKLSNKLASAKYSNPASDSQRKAVIDDSLTLISAQKILQEGTELGDEIALEGDDLIGLACEKIHSARNVDEIRRLGLCGLAIASAQPSGQFDAMADDASYIWQEIIQADIHLWRSVANDNSMAVGGISEEELIQRIEGTAFVAVVDAYLDDSPPGGNMQHVGFSDQVKHRVLRLFGSDELGKVLTVAAESSR